jgi:tyrosine-protein kinase Etk/Wzc
MNDVHNMARDSGSPGGDKIDLVDLLIAVVRRKKLVIGLPLFAFLASTAISTALPNVYQATTKLMPPQQAQGAAALLSQLGGMAGVAAGAAGLSTPNELYIGMLKSRTLADKLVSQFDLKKVYGVDTLERARAKLAERTEILASKDGLISIAVEDLDQKRVAPIANAYVDELTKLTRVLAVTEASQRRMFFERQLERAKDNLAAAEIKLKSAIDRTGVISVDGDSRAVVETTAALRAQVSAKEVQLNAMDAFVTLNNPDYKRVREELNSLRAELGRLENGRPAAGGASQQGLSKEGGLESVKILRDVKYHQMLYELLAKQYEAARLDEAKDTSIIQVLDPAVTPERKFKPNRTVFVLIATLLGFVLALLCALIAEFRQRASRNSKFAAQIAELKTNLRFR